MDRQRQAEWITWLAVLLFFLLFASTLVEVRIADMDLWGRLAMAAVVRQAGFPFTDDFSYTAQGHAWIDHEWMSGVVFLWLLNTFGDAGLLFLKAGLFFMIPGLWILYAIRRGTFNLVSVWLWFFCALYIIFSFYNTVRAHTFSWAFLSFWIYVLETTRIDKDKRSERLLLFLPLSMLFWVNLHGGWIVGSLILAIYYAASVVDQRRIKTAYFWPLLGMVAATLVTPYIPVSFYKHMAASYLTARTGIEEWNPVPIVSQPVSYLPLILLLGLALFSAAFCLKRGVTKFYLPVLIILLFSWQGFSHQKLLPVPMVAFGFYLPCLLTACFPISPFKGHQVVSVVFGVLIPVVIALPSLSAFTGLFRVGGWYCPPHDSFQSPAMRMYHNPPYPVGAIAYLQAVKATGRLWTPFDWGEYALWHLYPSTRVSIDGRLEELYPMELFHFSQVVSRGEIPFSSMTNALQPDWVLAKPGQAGPILENETWHLRYADSVSLLYSRAAATDDVVLDIEPANFSLQDHLGSMDRFNDYPAKR